MEEKIDYVNLMDIAKINLSNLINEAANLYKKEKNSENKNRLISLIYDRNKIFLFDKEIIKKYL